MSFNLYHSIESNVSIDIDQQKSSKCGHAFRSIKAVFFTFNVEACSCPDDSSSSIVSRPSVNHYLCRLNTFEQFTTSSSNAGLTIQFVFVAKIPSFWQKWVHTPRLRFNPLIYLTWNEPCLIFSRILIFKIDCTKNSDHSFDSWRVQRVRWCTILAH